MKRFFFTVLALAAVAVSCTKSGLLDSPQTYEDPISFEPYTGKAPVTKATVAETEDLYDAGFRVIGFEQTAGDATVSELKIASFATDYLDRRVYVEDKGASTITWKYDNAKYWPENKYLSFLAYGLNVNSDGNDDDTEIGLDESTCFVKKSDVTYTYTVDGDVENQKDLVISPIMQNKNSVSGTIAVKLYHVLSRVGFKVQTEGEAGVNVIIKDVKLTGTGLASADFNLTNAVVATTTGTGTEEKTTIAYANDATDESGAITGGTSLSYSLFDTDYKHTQNSYNNNNPNDASKSFPAFIMRSGDSATTEAIFANTTFKTSAKIKENNEDKTVDYDPALISADDITAALNKDDSDRFMMIIPQTLRDAKIEVIYQLSGAEEQKAEVDLQTFAFKAGKAYEFVFSVSTVSVGFGVQVGAWQQGFSTDNGDNNYTQDEGYFPLTPVE